LDAIEIRDPAPAFVERLTCPVCGAGDARHLVTLPYDEPPLDRYLEDFYQGRLRVEPLAGWDFVLERCGDCGLVYQRFVPAADVLHELYDQVAVAAPDDVASRRGLRVRQAYAADIELAIAHLGGDPAGLRVLDHGAGTGLWLQMAAAYGCRTAATELSDPGRERLAALGHEVFDPDELPSGRFDLINSEQVFEHLLDPAASIASLGAALRPGGLLRLSVPNGSDISSRLEVGDWLAPKGSAASLNAVAPLEHVNCFDHGSLHRLATSAGLAPFRFPIRRHLDPMARLRPAAGALLHRLRPPNGTLQWFRRPG
jgi:SAM-dependent methyltransferase